MNYVTESNKKRNKMPFLYSYRRCPYAMRARMALVNSGIDFDIVEISLKDKPKDMLDISPKGTVPILVNGDQIIDESLDIMEWAYQSFDLNNHYSCLNVTQKKESYELININDSIFKFSLDKYKYSSNYKTESIEDLYQKCLFFIDRLEKKLSTSEFIITNNITFADVAIFPFVRQFVNVNLERFLKGDYIKTIEWYQKMSAEEIFLSVMVKPNPKS